MIIKDILLDIYHVLSTITDTHSINQNSNLKTQQADAESFTQLKNQNGRYLNLSKRNVKII